MSTLLLVVGIVLLATVVVFLGRIPTLVSLLFALTYKSTVVSLFSCEIEESLLFRALQAVDFIFAGTVVLVILCTSGPVRARLLQVGSLVSRNMLLVALVLVFGVVAGLLFNPVDHVAIYLRLLAYPFLLYVIGVWLARRLELRTVAWCAVVVLLPAAWLVMIEFLLRPQYHDAINSACYHSLKFGRPSGWYRLEDMLLFSNMRLFNLEVFGNIQFIKPYGVTLNYPSTSYLMSFGLLCALLCNRRVLAATFLCALLLMTTKASLFMLLSLAIVPMLAVRLSGRLLHVALWSWLMGFGVAATTWLMVTGVNIHAYSLLASLASVVVRPLGGGIGWGGSLTSTEMSRTWDSDMLVGDSGLAILINMLGVAGFAVFFLYAQMFVRAARAPAGMRASREQLLVAAFGVGVTGNAILQELAVGPYAVGLAILLLAVQHNRGSRQ